MFIFSTLYFQGKVEAKGTFMTITETSPDLLITCAETSNKSNDDLSETASMEQELLTVAKSGRKLPNIASLVNICGYKTPFKVTL